MPNEPKAFKVKANEFEFYFDAADLNSVDLVKKSTGVFNLIKNHRSVNACILEVFATGKAMKIAVEGEIFEVEIKDELDQLLEKMGYGVNEGKKIKEIKAPMPGLVIGIDVIDGQEVKEGDRLLVLEAMKMENSILIHLNAVIKRVAVSGGQAVEKGQVLVELE